MDYVLTQPPWESSLLTEINLSDDVFTLVDRMSQWHQLHPSGNFLSATDGSSTPQYGSFGWTLNDSDGTRYAHHKGIAFGLPSTSFRSKAYGLLSFLCFWKHLHWFMHTSPRSPLLIFLHSQSLIDKSTEQNNWYDDFGSTTMQPDWDILQAIRTLC